VRSQRELLEASAPDPEANTALPHLDVNANELMLVYRARGMPEDEALNRARRVIEASKLSDDRDPVTGPVAVAAEHEVIGSAWGAALSSFCFFASGAVIPVLPWIFGLSGVAAVLLALLLVGVVLMSTGAMVGLLSGAPPLRRALRQLAIGFGAAAVTYVLGLLFDVTLH
jgi:VIT1/CCC1 family predicted Fe2+/Mn2+ transporter